MRRDTDARTLWGMTPITLRLTELREAKGWTQRELARRASIRAATVNSLESRAPQKVDLSVLERLANALGVDAAFLFVHEHGSTGSRTGRRKGKG